MLGGAAVYSAWVLAISVMRGSDQFAQLGMTTWGIIGLYFVAAVPAGIALGLGRPYLRRRFGAILVGALVGGGVYATIGLPMFGPEYMLLGIGAASGALVGSVVGYLTWKETHQAGSGPAA